MPTLRLIVSLALSLAACAAHAEIAGDKVRIGVLTDLSGATRQHPAQGRSKVPAWLPRNSAAR